MTKDLRERTVEILLTVLALLSLAVLAGIVFYLFKEGLPIFKLLTPLNFIFGTDWYPVGDQPDFEIGSLIAGSLAVTFLSSLIAVPLGLMTAAYLYLRTHGARKRCLYKAVGKRKIHVSAAGRKALHMPVLIDYSDVFHFWFPPCDRKSGLTQSSSLKSSIVASISDCIISRLLSI